MNIRTCFIRAVPTAAACIISLAACGGGGGEGGEALAPGLTGCATGSLYVLPADGERLAPTWPVIDTRYALRVRSTVVEGNGAWVSGCGSRLWLP